MSNKVSINISTIFLRSFGIGLAIGIVVVFIAHLSPSNWYFRPLTSSTYIAGDSKVARCGYECAFGRRHSADCSSTSASDVSSKKLSISEILNACIDDIGILLIIAVIVGVAIYLGSRVNFKIVK